jgi:TorA-specific chaperone
MAELSLRADPAADAAAEREASAFLFHWLATIFAAAPTVEQVEAFRTGAGAPLLAALTDDPDLAPAVRAMRQALLRAGAAKAAAVEIETSFNLLFLGLSGPETVPPYESAHTSEDGRLFQQATVRMDALLSSLGMSASGLPAEPSDHVSIELETLAELIRRGDEAGRSRFVEDHLLVWIPSFCRMAIARDRQGFYGAAARLLGVLVERESVQRQPAIALATKTEDASCRH